MGRVFKVIIALTILFFVFQFAITFFKDYHFVKYELITSDQEVVIKEEFSLLNDMNNYYLQIIVDDMTFNYYLNNDFKKEQKILEDIIYYDDEIIQCIFPVFKNDITGEVLCHKNGNYYTQDTLSDASKFVDFLTEKNYNNDIFVSNDTSVIYDRLEVYQNNIPIDVYLSVWNYRGIDILSNTEIDSVNVLSDDRYNNDTGTIVDKYYFIPNYNQEHDFNSFFVIDIAEFDSEKKFLSLKISFDSYVNGVVDNILYLTDKDNRVQYSYDVNKDILEVVGEESVSGRFFDGEWREVAITDLVDENIYFSSLVTLDEELSDYDVKQVEVNGDFYYILTNSGEIFRINKNDYSNGVLIISDSNISEFILRDDMIFYLSNDTVYSYSSLVGIKPIVKSNEFIYNSKNIFDVYKR